MIKLFESHKEEIVNSFVMVCEGEGLEVNRAELNLDDIMDELLCALTVPSNMEALLDDTINNCLLSEMDGVECKEEE